MTEDKEQITDNNLNNISYHKNASIQKTYIPGLDDHLRGGIPKGNTILLKGAKSTGKTVFMCQSCAISSKYGVKSLIINLEMTEEEIIHEMMKFGADPNSLKENVKILTIPINRFFQEDNKDIGKISIISEIDEALKSFKATNIFVDSLTTITASRDLFLLPIVKHDKKSKKDIEIAFESVKKDDRFFFWFVKSFKKYDANVYLLGADKNADLGSETRYFGLFENAVDWIIAFYAEHFRNDVARWLIVEKSRLSNVSGAVKSFRIIQGIGITVHDFKVEPNKIFDKDIETVPYGLPAVDKALSGGQIVPGLTLLYGPSGKGKTVFSLVTSYNRGINNKRVLYISFEQNERDLRLQAYRLGFDLYSIEKRNIIYFIYIDLAEIDDKILAKISRIIKWHHPDIMVLDSITDLECNIPMSELNEEGGIEEGTSIEEAKKRWTYTFTNKLRELSAKYNLGILLLKSCKLDEGYDDKVFDDVDVALSLDSNNSKKIIEFGNYDLSLSILKSRFTKIENKYKTLPCKICNDKGFDFPYFFLKNYFKITPKSKFIPNNPQLEREQDENPGQLPSENMDLIRKMNKKIALEEGGIDKNCNVLPEKLASNSKK